MKPYIAVILLSFSFCLPVQKAEAATIDSTYDLVYHRISISVDPATSAAINNGAVTSYFKTMIANFSTIQFDLDYSRMNVTSVTYHGNTRTWTKIAPATISISIPNIVNAGTLDSITVNYNGTPLIASTSGVPSGYNYQLHNGQYAIYTLGESFTGHNWWPCKESLSDKIDSVDLIVTTPSGYKVAGNGLVTEVTAGANLITTWKTRYPIATYGINFAVANYQNYQYNISLGGKTLPLLNYFYAEDYASYKGYADSLKTLIPAYSNLLKVNYPFLNEKYGFADCAGGNWGALEVQSMTFIATQSFADSGYTMAHELAHQWFGDMVTTSSWHPIWLNEGFAQYFQQVIYPELIKPGSLYYQRSNLKSKVSGSSTVYVPDTSNANAIFIPSSSVAQPYEKGAMLISMLRTWVGDSAFFDALHNYLTAPGVQYNFASVDTLKKYMQQQTPLDLTDFFNDWVYKSGYPNYTVKWAASGKKITLKLVQSSTTASGAGYFDMALPIRIRNTTNGFDTTIVVIDKRGTLYFSGASPGSGSGTISFNLSSVPNSVSFDPNNMVLAKATAISIDNTILPIREIILSAQKIGEVVQLQWTVSSDEKLNAVTLERSVDGKMFTGIYSPVLYPLANGNESGSYQDRQLSEKLFYRLKITQYNNSVVYSEIKSLELNNRISIRIFPNPALDKISISIADNNSNGKYSLIISSMHGETLTKLQGWTAPGDYNVSVRDWLPGTYIINLLKNDNPVMKKMILKL